MTTENRLERLLSAARAMGKRDAEEAPTHEYTQDGECVYERSRGRVAHKPTDYVAWGTAQWECYEQTGFEELLEDAVCTDISFAEEVLAREAYMEAFEYLMSLCADDSDC